jgi:hypothetical protein
MDFMWVESSATSGYMGGAIIVVVWWFTYNIDVFLSDLCEKEF